MMTGKPLAGLLFVVPGAKACAWTGPRVCHFGVRVSPKHRKFRSGHRGRQQTNSKQRATPHQLLNCLISLQKTAFPCTNAGPIRPICKLDSEDSVKLALRPTRFDKRFSSVTTRAPKGEPSPGRYLKKACAFMILECTKMNAGAPPQKGYPGS